MLFDLQGKRKRFIQIVYALLAALFLISFVGFGIGSDAAGGIFDAFGLGSNSSGTSNPEYEQEIEDAEARLEQDPKNERALLDLARIHFLAAQNEFEQDESGATVVTENAQVELEASADAWQRYLALDPSKADGGVALQLGAVYDTLMRSAAQSDPQALPAILEEGEQTARIAAEQQPSANTYLTWAQFAYFAGDTKAGDEAAKKLLAEVDSAQRKTAERQLEQLEKTGEQIEKFVKQSAPGKEALTNPLLGESAAPTP